ncbi:hypothetical protein Rs2_05205 [Raphanus sativus]|nr:hypothetical protein Rs2_05205 [Raphanus sativus]
MMSSCDAAFVSPTSFDALRLGRSAQFIVARPLCFWDFRNINNQVDDGNDNATFVVFDGEMPKLTKKDAATLTVDEINGGGGEQLLQCLEELGGKKLCSRSVLPRSISPKTTAHSLFLE